VDAWPPDCELRNAVRRPTTPTSQHKAIRRRPLVGPRSSAVSHRLRTGRTSTRGLASRTNLFGDGKTCVKANIARLCRCGHNGDCRHVSIRIATVGKQREQAVDRGSRRSARSRTATYSTRCREPSVRSGQPRQFRSEQRHDDLGSRRASTDGARRPHDWEFPDGDSAPATRRCVAQRDVYRGTRYAQLSLVNDKPADEAHVGLRPVLWRTAVRR